MDMQILFVLCMACIYGTCMAFMLSHIFTFFHSCFFSLCQSLSSVLLSQLIRLSVCVCVYMSMRAFFYSLNTKLSIVSCIVCEFWFHYDFYLQHQMTLILCQIDFHSIYGCDSMCICVCECVGVCHSLVHFASRIQLNTISRYNLRKLAISY